MVYQRLPSNYRALKTLQQQSETKTTRCQLFSPLINLKECVSNIHMPDAVTDYDWGQSVFKNAAFKYQDK